MKIDIIYSNASFSSKSSHQFLPNGENVHYIMKLVYLNWTLVMK